MLLIRGTADIILARHATGKKDLSSSFLPDTDTNQENWEGTNYINGILAQKTCPMDAGEEMQIDGDIDLNPVEETQAKSKARGKRKERLSILSTPSTSASE